jgi:alkylation response protein AidB-like acyl-CoA dehydrogenase
MSIIAPAELAKQTGENGKPLWVQIGDKVFDVTKFAGVHPGGRAILERFAGQDCTQQFRLFHNDTILPKYQDRIPVVGMAVDSRARDVSKARASLLDAKHFGDQVPYGDPFWYQRSSRSPYYKPTHFAFRERVRAFVDQDLMPTMNDWVGASRPPSGLVQKMGSLGFLACMAGGPPFPAAYVDAGTPCPEDFDYFHVLILLDELARCGNSAVLAALTNGPSIACSAIMRYGNDSLKRRVLPDVLMGRKMIALGVSEVNAGSDVSGLVTFIRAERDGEVVVINGTKKWITNGMYADYITLLAKDDAAGGMSIVVVPTDSEGFTAKKVAIRDSDLSGTALLDLVNVKVPRENVVGKPGSGWTMQMAAFNFERFYLVALVLRLSRICLEECIKYALKRETFGVKLHQHQAVRMRVAEMIRDVEGLQAWTEAVAYQMSVLPYIKAQLVLGDITGLLKAQATLVYERCARHSLHVFGGNAVMMRGPGHRVEPALGQSKGYLIPGGALDIMDDFGARQAFKLAQQVAKL